MNALAPLGVQHLDMPATPSRIWRAIEAARLQSPGPGQDRASPE
jgi:carbon-monoxide dehydrogenase large subunit